MGQNKSTPINPISLVNYAVSNADNPLASQTHVTKYHLNAQNFVLIWLDSNMDESNVNFKHSLTQLRRIVNTINIFTDADQCLDFLTEIKDEKVFMIISGTLGQQLVSIIHDISQLYSIYIFCADGASHQVWAKEWAKVKGVFTQIEPLCNSLEQDTKKCDHDLIPISIISTNELEPTFMYSQILKKILLTIDYGENAKEDLAQLWREQYHNNEFEQNYYRHSPIWWYTRDCFICQLLNRALRLQEINTILKVGFFIRDLHQQIEQLYIRPSGKLTVYRGQGLLNMDFEKIRIKQGALISFNNFLSTSTDRQVSLLYAESARENPELTGIVFQISIDPACTSTPFASLDNVSFFSDSEKEILFSMHTVFRIGQILPIENRLWLVELTLTSADDDQELKQLTEQMREEIQEGTEWHQLGALMYKMGNFDKAEEIYRTLLQKTSKDDEEELAHLYHRLGGIKDSKGNYEEALQLYRKTLEIGQKYLHSDHPDLAQTYNNIGLVYVNMGAYFKALEFYQKTYEIQQKSLSPNHPDLATTYNNIGMTYDRTGEYSKALVVYQKSLDIKQKSLPPNHPDLAKTYNNIGMAYVNMEEYSKALEILQKALEIRRKSLPPNHPNLANTYSNIGMAYISIGEYSRALESFQTALEIVLTSLPSNHPQLATIYNNIASVYHHMEVYSKALECLLKGLEIYLISLPSNHPNLANIYSNIGEVYNKMGEYSKALEFFQKSLEIFLTYLSSNHPTLAITYNYIASMYLVMGENSKAVEEYQRSLEIFLTLLPPNHLYLAVTYNNIATVYQRMGAYSKSLEFFQKTLEINQQSLSPNHPDLAQIYNNIGWLYTNLREYPKALSFHQRAVQIGENSLPENHSDLRLYRKNLTTLLYHKETCNVL